MMILRIGAASALALAVILLAVAWRQPRGRAALRVAGGAALALAVALALWPQPLTVYHPAHVPAGTVLVYQSGDVENQVVKHNALHGIRAADAAEAWERDLSDDATAQIYQGQILVMAPGVRTSTLTALAPADGQQRWRLAGLPPNGLFTLAGTTVYVEHFDDARHAHLTAYALTTQQPLWSAPVDLVDVTQVVALPDALYAVGTAVVALHPADGQVLWRAEVPTSGSPRVNGGTSPIRAALALPGILIAETATEVRAYDAATGALRWQSAPVPSGFASLATDAGALIAQTNDGRLIAWDAATGATRWQQPFRSFGFPTTAGGVVYATSAGKGTLTSTLVHAYDLATGTERWQARATTATATNVLGSDVLVNDSYRDGAPRPNLLVIDPATGQPRLTISAPGDYTNWNSPTRIADTLFVVANDHKLIDCSFNCGSGSSLRAYDLHNGQPQWELHTNVVGILGTA